MQGYNFNQWYNDKAIYLSNLPNQYPKKNIYIRLIHHGNIVFAKFKGFDSNDSNICILYIKSYKKTKVNKLIDFLNEHYLLNFTFLKNNNKYINHINVDKIEIHMPKELLVKLDTNLYINFSSTTYITHYLYNIAYYQIVKNNLNIPLNNLIRIFISFNNIGV